MTLATDYTHQRDQDVSSVISPKQPMFWMANRRFPVNFNKYPELSLEYFMGFKDFLNGDFDYHKLVAGIHHSFTAGGAGAFVYDIRFTKVFDPLPYPLLITLAGNQSLFRTNRTYNLMNYGEFVLDEALELFLAYHMDGLILGRIPLIKKTSMANCGYRSCSIWQFRLQ